MTKSDTWPGGVAMEALSNTDSAGSWDSVISTNSGFSDESMEHLSPEERACLMYLEETIEALEVQEDSGLSNDELDHGLQPEKMGVNDISSLNSNESEGDHTSDVADHHTQPDLKTSTNDKRPPQTGVMCFKDKDGKIKIVSSASLRQSPSTQASETDPDLILPSTSTKSSEAVSDLIRPPSSTKASGTDLDLIPPPSDFMDDPEHPARPVTPNDLSTQQKRPEDLLPPSASSHKPGPSVDLMLLHQRASAKKTPESSSVVHKLPNLILPTNNSDPPMGPPPEVAELRSPPVVAPKPKRLPANILLKSHKAGAAAAEGNSPTGSEWLLSDRERIHQEALRKLGLLKSDEGMDLVPTPSPRNSPQTRRSWAAPPSPVSRSTAALHTPPSTPYHGRVNTPSPVSVLLHSPAPISGSGPSVTPAVIESPDILPAPAAFSDPNILSDNKLSEDGSDATSNMNMNLPPQTPPALVKQLNPHLFTGVKSATLERSGLGLSSYIARENSDSDVSSDKQSPSLSQLRNSRPRPASLGSGKDFSAAQSSKDSANRREPDLRRSLPAVQHTGDAKKLPRSQGISVLICPRSENTEDRRDALKRLGLIRD